MLEQQAEQARGNGADHEQPAELRIGVVGVDVAVPEGAPEALEDPDPVLEEEEEEDDRGRAMGGDQEAQEVVVVLMDVPAEDARQNDAVPEARDREELG